MPKKGAVLPWKTVVHSPARDATETESAAPERNYTLPHSKLREADAEARGMAQRGCTVHIEGVREKDKVRFRVYTYTPDNVPDELRPFDLPSDYEVAESLMVWYREQGFEPVQLGQPMKPKPKEILYLQQAGPARAELPATECKPVPPNPWRKFRDDHSEHVLYLELQHRARLAGVDLGETHIPERGPSQVAVDIAVLLDLLQRLEKAESTTPTTDPD